MSTGAPALVTSQKREKPVPPGPPFPAGSADNGLSLGPAGEIVLGNDVGSFLAALLSDRELPMGAFAFTWLNGTNRQFIVDPLNELYGLGDFDTSGIGACLSIDNISGIIGLGTNAGNKNALVIIDPTNQTFLGKDSGTALSINGTTGQAQLGDITSSGTTTILEVDDINSVITARANVEFKHIDRNGAIFLDSDVLTGLYRFGDISAALNNSFLSIDDTNFVIDMGRVAGGNYMELDTSNGEFIMLGGGVNQLRFSPVSAVGTWELGDVTAAANGTRFHFDDATGIFSFTNSATTAAYACNGVTGFTGTVTPVTSITVNGGIVTSVT